MRFISEFKQFAMRGDFTLIAFCIFFAVKLINFLQNNDTGLGFPKKTNEEKLLTEISDLLQENLKS